MRFAYADPAYPGLARRYYGKDEVDHAELIERLGRLFPDGWALSTSSKALRDVLLLCPPDVRVCPWVRTPRFGRSYRPRDAWEALIVRGGRARLLEVHEDVRNALVFDGRQHSHPGALVGMKPAAFCVWMFQQLGALPGDELVDLFPGSGAVGRAWSLYTSQPPAGRVGRPPATRRARQLDATIKASQLEPRHVARPKTTRLPGKRDVSAGKARRNEEKPQ